MDATSRESPADAKPVIVHSSSSLVGVAVSVTLANVMPDTLADTKAVPPARLSTAAAAAPLVRRAMTSTRSCRPTPPTAKSAPLRERNRSKSSEAPVVKVSSGSPAHCATVGS